MGEVDYFNDIFYIFCYWDFFLCNILILVNLFIYEFKIEGIFDWDLVLFVFVFMICEFFVYLWNSKLCEEVVDEECEDWYIDFIFDFIIEEDKKVKRVFEEVVGEEYVCFVYNLVYFLVC